MRWLPVIIVAAATTAAPAIAQIRDTCEHGTAQAYLNTNDVLAMIPNTGSLFWRGGHSTYEVPQGSGNHANFTGALAIGGMVGKELRMAASLYGPWEFWPGPSGSSPEECQKYDRIFEVKAIDLDIWLETGDVTRDMVDWPWQVGASVVDGDGIPGNYNLDGGDHPELLGDQTLWWIMNDAGGAHRAYKTNPLEIEVAVTAFSSTLAAPLMQTTFYHYRITKRGTESLRDGYISLYWDTDLGNGTDDYIGSDSTLGMGYTYNADNDDDGAYGTAPPAIGVVVLNAPAVYRTAFLAGGQIDTSKSSYLTSVSNLDGGGGASQGNPRTPERYYNFMQGLWGTGETKTLGGKGHGVTNEPMPFAYPGEPGEFWSELNIDDKGGSNTPSNRHWIMSTGPFDLDSGEATEFYFAVVWSRGTDHLDSVLQLKKDAAIIKQVAPILLKPIYSFEPEILPEPEFDLGLGDIYPNPATGWASLEYSLPQPMRVRLEVFDVLGRRVHNSGDEVREAGEYTARFDTSDWPAGLYVVRLQLDLVSATKTLLVVK